MSIATTCIDTDEFYAQSCEAGYVKLDAIARSIHILEQSVGAAV